MSTSTRLPRTTQLTIPLPLFDGEAVGISRVERETGLSKDILRAWERRYGFPQPTRDANGGRTYSTDQIEKLRLLRRLTEQGLRPGKIIALDLAQLDALSQPGSAPPQSAQLTPFVEVLREHDIGNLRRMLTQRLARDGLSAFVLDTVAPLHELLRDLWMHAELSEFEVKAGAEQMQSLLRGAMQGAANEDMTPRVVIASAHEQEAINHLILEAVLCVSGTLCVPLGSGTPIREIAQAAGGFRAHAVAVPVSSSSQEISASLANLRSLLPPAIELWAQGQNLSRLRRLPPNIHTAASRPELTLLVRHWKTRHGQ
ncbi:MAG: MerR family transcriptional regulator [Betaproteobacteria bacterium]|nr:MerR family transcriptional regulator [Betaproteobacteria bacterium]